MYQAQPAGFGWQGSTRVPCMEGGHDLPCARPSWFQLELTLMQIAHCVPKLLQLGEPAAPLLRQWWDSSSRCARRKEEDAEKRNKTEGDMRRSRRTGRYVVETWRKCKETCLKAQWWVTHGEGDTWREILLGTRLEALGRNSSIPKEVDLWGTATVGDPSWGRDLPEGLQPMDDLCWGRGKQERSQEHQRKMYKKQGAAKRVCYVLMPSITSSKELAWLNAIHSENKGIWN